MLRTPAMTPYGSSELSKQITSPTVGGQGCASGPPGVVHGQVARVSDRFYCLRQSPMVVRPVSHFIMEVLQFLQCAGWDFWYWWVANSHRCQKNIAKDPRNLRSLMDAGAF